MAIELPPEPVRNTPITAEWGRKVVRALRALCPVAGSGMIVDIAPGGTTYRLSEMPRAARRSQLTLRAWQPKFLLEKENANSSGASAYRLAMRVGSIAYLTAEGETQFPEVEAALTGTLNDGKLDLASKEVSAGILYLGCERSAGTARWVLELGAADLPLAEADSEGILRFRRKALAEIDPDNRTVTALVSGGRIEIRDPATGGGSGGAPGADGEDGVGIDSITTTEIAASSGTRAGTKITITLTDGTSKDFTIYNGQDGQDGADGQDGQDGGAADLPEPVELTVVTGIKYEENKLTMTTQVVKAYLAETPAAATAATIFTATAHSEEHS